MVWNHILGQVYFAYVDVWLGVRQLHAFNGDFVGQLVPIYELKEVVEALHFFAIEVSEIIF